MNRNRIMISHCLSLACSPLLAQQTFEVFVGPSYSKTFGVPATPSLAGVQINLQAWFPSPTVFPAATSNGVALRLGN